MLAHTPVSTGKYQQIYNSVDSKLKNPNDGNISLFEIKDSNQDGKGTVGIMANGLKTFFALTQYFNQYYQKGGGNFKNKC